MPRQLPSLFMLVMAIGLTGYGLWIPAKAELAQWLLKDAWQKTLLDGGKQKPWSWADHWPVARLLAPAAGIDQIVLEGDSGNVLAFAPGHSSQSAMPGSGSAVVISGHRDTHFSFLKDLQQGQQLHLQTVKGDFHYAVMQTQIVDSRMTRLTPHLTDEQLVLVTCYPFDSPVAGGPLRYVVTAKPVTRREKNTASTPF
jgi:sortase A